jgi:putative transposase
LTICHERDDDCLKELGWLYERRNIKEARADLKAWIERWQDRYPKLVAWVEENNEETLTYFSLPQAHHKNMKSTNMLERLNEEIRRRTRVVRIFPNCLRLVRALAVEQHETWQEDNRYIKEMKRERGKAAA